MSNKYSKWFIVFSVIFYFLINFYFSFPSNKKQIDVTEEQLYTLSSASIDVLTGLDKPIEITLFYSERLGREIPMYSSYRRRVKELLINIERLSNGMVAITEQNPEPFTEAEDDAVALGIQAVPIDDSDERVYFGLVGRNQNSEQEVIPFFQTENETLLERELMSLIYHLSSPIKKSLGLISSLPVLGDMKTQMHGGVMVPWGIGKALKSHFDVQNLPQSFDHLPQALDTVVLIHPQSLSPRASYELEQYLFRGGRAVIFIDPKSESDVSVGPNETSSSSQGFEPMLSAWGVEVSADQIVVDKTMAMRINGGSATRPEPIDYLPWLKVGKDGMNQNNAITHDLEALHVATAGSIRLKADSGLEMEPLLYSTQNSNTIHPDLIKGTRPDIQRVQAGFLADDDRYIIAGKLSGVVKTAFTEGAPKALIDSSVDGQPDSNQLMLSEGSINLILVADTDLLADRFWLQKDQFYGRTVEKQFAANADFVLNAVSHLSGEDVLMRLTEKNVTQRLLDKIIALKNNAEQRLQEKERQLHKKLNQAQLKVAELEEISLSSAQAVKALNIQKRTEISAIRADMLLIREDLRKVQYEMKKDMDQLIFWVQFVNIGLIPLMLCVIAWFIYFARKRSQSVDCYQ